MLKKIIVIASTAIFAFALSFGVAVSGDQCPGHSKVDAKSTAAKEGETTIMLNVSGMTCGGCVAHITKALNELEGVGDVTVSLEQGTAKINYDAAKVKPEAMTAAIVKAGYKAEVSDSENTATAGAKACDPANCAKKGCDPKACTGAKMTGDEGK